MLLLLPFSTKSGHISLIDALFTSTSAICVTGLIVQDTATYFTPIGQIIILFLIQLGGLGIMTFSTLVLMVAGKRISIKDRIIIQNGFHPSAPKSIQSLIKNIFLYAMTFELLGCLSLFLRWRKEFSWPQALFHSSFHSISAFCNAGFSRFSQSLVNYRGDIWVNLTMILLIVFGGLGFLVLQELKEGFSGIVRRKKIHVSLHARLVLTITSCLIFFSFIIFFIIERNYSLKMFSLKEKILASLFQIVTPRTAGFITMDMNTLSAASVFLLIILMFIGASPGSTGGGVKTSTVGVILAFLKSRIAARDSVNIFYRTLPHESVTRAYTIVTLALSLLAFSSFVLFVTQPLARMEEVFFEVFSAFGTVGLSLGTTAKLSSLGKIMIVLTMYIGRIGPLTFLYAFSRHKPFGRYEYVEENVMIG